jgi:hypothetical protein
MTVKDLKKNLKRQPPDELPYYDIEILGTAGMEHM